ncbi:hypothetical protein SAMN05216511_4313 [Streptomyces sp. KS_16]|nr:hypothetical protein BX261_2889 [Streptomyces sp. 2321.6]SDR45957.1 hypothetical protein SAMN05216511_4313 [Streptomyces sp. KS_16]SEC78849.1 hypothetical protein SAMN05428940_2892 [Streptomyces sp. 2133.1]SNC69046.1 hypothetical protein SAMN06272741_2886 [Streptomyces sp. 2114.4]
MAHDLLDPGPDHNGRPAYLVWPRDANGAPCFTDTHTSADVVFPQPGAAPVTRGTVRQRGTLVDLTHRDADGKPLIPPTIPLDVLRQMWTDQYG